MKGEILLTFNLFNSSLFVFEYFEKKRKSKSVRFSVIKTKKKIHITAETYLSAVFKNLRYS